MRTQTRPWRKIADELLREPNRWKMAQLLNELNQTPVELQEANIMSGWYRESTDGKHSEQPDDVRTDD